MKKIKYIQDLEFQVVSPPEGNGNILEVLDENQEEVMSIAINEKDKKYLTIFSSKNDIVLPLSKLQEILEMAEKNVKNFNVGD